MKLEIYKNNYTNPNYQLFVMYDAKNVARPTNVLDLEIVDIETSVKYKLGELLEIKDKEIKELQTKLEQVKTDFTNKTDRLYELIKALTEETRNKGVI